MQLQTYDYSTGWKKCSKEMCENFRKENTLHTYIQFLQSYCNNSLITIHDCVLCAINVYTTLAFNILNHYYDTCIPIHTVQVSKKKYTLCMT